jgi:subtilase family serine protease
VDVLNTKNPPLVHSVSYGDDEYTVSVEYMQRCDVEFMKAGTMGLTILLASGDMGVSASTPGVGCNGQFYPSFPSSSPHVTTVGATQFSTQTTPSCDMTTGSGLPARCTHVGEIASSTRTGSRISSGGGFSNLVSGLGGLVVWPCSSSVPCRSDFTVPLLPPSLLARYLAVPASLLPGA